VCLTAADPGVAPGAPRALIADCAVQSPHLNRQCVRGQTSACRTDWTAAVADCLRAAAPGVRWGGPQAPTELFRVESRPWCWLLPNSHIRRVNHATTRSSTATSKAPRPMRRLAATRGRPLAPLRLRRSEASVDVRSRKRPAAAVRQGQSKESSQSSTKYGWIYIKQTQNDNLTGLGPSDPPSALLRAGA
jgi:hypothetical protein